MDKPKGKVLYINICCFGVSHVGVPLSAVIAHMCPSLNVVVVDLNPERIALFNTKQIPIREPGLEEMLKKCQNRNLVFTTNTVGAIKISDIIFISLNSPVNSCCSEEKKSSSLADIEKAARLIAEESENDKIIVLKNTVPVGSNEIIKRIFLANKDSNVTFQVLSVPEFFSSGNAVSSLLNPDRILIGSDLTEDALKATETLVSVYTQWVPRDRIITMSSWSAELAKLTQNAFLAQRLSDVGALTILCEESGADISDVIKMIGKCSEIGSEYLEPSFGYGGAHLKNDLKCLTYMCERLNLFEAAEYWKQVLLMNEYQKRRFTKKILSCFFNTLNHKKIAIWGVAFKRDAETAVDSPAIDLCLNLLNEGAKLTLYDPKMERRQLKDELTHHLKEVKFCAKEVAYCDDPYKAARKTNAIVICTDWEQLRNIDYNLIYRDMLRPAYIFDGRKCLPHEQLMKIGFVVKTIGKEFDEATKF